MRKSIVYLIHAGYWIAYVVLLFTIFSLFAPLIPGVEKGKFFHMAIFWWGRMLLGFAIVPGIISFYSFYFILYNSFFSKKRMLQFSVSAIGVLLACAAIGEVLCYFTVPQAIWNFENIISIAIIMSVNSLANGILGLFIKGFIVSYGDIKVKEEMVQKNQEMELALIKAQINPHFLFNTINNIDVLIGKDPVKASQYLNKLSDIMRFMLYETKAEKISLTTELDYINKYIDLQKIRTSNLDFVNFVITGKPGNHMISPMLFIPFIENAFKHAEDLKKQDAIDITFTLDESKIIFESRNKYIGSTATKIRNSGLGNDLIKKRLILLYPGKHQLEVTDKDGTYNVKLILNNEG